MTSAVALIKVPYPVQIELALEFGPDAATARLISTFAEEAWHPRDNHREGNCYQTFILLISSHNFWTLLG